jgi:hypothetical protein
MILPILLAVGASTTPVMAQKAGSIEVAENTIVSAMMVSDKKHDRKHTAQPA